MRPIAQSELWGTHQRHAPIRTVILARTKHQGPAPRAQSHCRSYGGRTSATRPFALSELWGTKQDQRAHSHSQSYGGRSSGLMASL